MRGWRNWQTHYLEVVAPVRAWRFKSSPAHHRKTGCLWTSCFSTCVSERIRTLQGSGIGSEERMKCSFHSRRANQFRVDSYPPHPLPRTNKNWPLWSVFVCVHGGEDLNAGAEFFNRKFSEAVPRPSASDGERLSRGKILSRAFL